MIQEVYKYLREVKHLQESTIDEYRKDIREFVSFATAKQLRWTTVNASDIIAWIQAMSEQNIKPATLRRRISCLRTVYKYLTKFAGVKSNPLQGIDLPKLAKKLPEYCPVERWLAYLKTSITSERSRYIHAYVALSLETGIRVSEAMNLQTSQFDKVNHSIRIQGKGNKQRIVYYGEMTKAFLAAYNPHACGYVFNMRDERQLRKDLSDEMRPFVNYVHPHMLRHTYASEMVANGYDIYTLSKLLGHESVMTTERYLQLPQSRLRTASEMYQQSILTKNQQYGN